MQCSAVQCSVVKYVYYSLVHFILQYFSTLRTIVREASSVGSIQCPLTNSTLVQDPNFKWEEGDTLSLYTPPDQLAEQSNTLVKSEGKVILLSNLRRN